MLLSYGWRLICVALFSFGAIQILLDASVWLASPAMLRALERTSFRFRERSLLLAQLATHGLAFLLAFLLLVPLYIRHEVNVLEERVGWLCLFLIAAIVYRYADGMFRGLALWRRTSRWQRNLRKDAALPSAGVPMVCVSDERPLLAVTGLFSPNIVVSRGLLTGKTLSPAALEVALEHENSHARNCDNLKLLLLSCLPHLELNNAARPSLLRRWQSFAELAADADAVGESRSRSVLLAEALVTVARLSSPMPSRILSTGLLAHEEDLEKRVSRLLAPIAPAVSCDPPSALFMKAGGAIFLAAGASTLFGLVVYSWQVLAEFLLHLG